MFGCLLPPMMWCLENETRKIRRLGFSLILNKKQAPYNTAKREKRVSFWIFFSYLVRDNKLIWKDFVSGVCLSVDVEWGRDVVGMYLKIFSLDVVKWCSVGLELLNNANSCLDKLFVLDRSSSLYAFDNVLFSFKIVLLIFLLPRPKRGNECSIACMSTFWSLKKRF
jgi:hypothetical protein